MKTVVQDWNAENAAGKLAELCIRLGFLDRGDVNFANEQGSAELQKTVKAQKMQENVRQQEADLMQELQDKDEIYAGPCSAAPVISERKMYARLMKEALRR